MNAVALTEPIITGWSATGSYRRTERYTTGVRYTFPREPSADYSRDLVIHSHRTARIVLSEGKPGTDGTFPQFFDEWRLVNVPPVLSFPPSFSVRICVRD
jgi:hypothetical protein